MGYYDTINNRVATPYHYYITNLGGIPLDSSIIYHTWDSNPPTATKTLNEPVIIGNRVDIKINIFNNDTVFNSPVTIGTYADCAFLFYRCNIFDQPVIIPKGVSNCKGMFRSCSNMTSSVTFEGNRVKDCGSMFAGCSNFNNNNQPFIFPEGIVQAPEMFSYCYNFNQTFVLPDSIENCDQMFQGCNQLSFMELPKNAKSCWSFYKYLSQKPADAFPPVVNIPDSVENCVEMFGYVYNFNSFVNIPKNCTNAAYMFSGCRDFNHPINFMGTKCGTSTNGYLIFGYGGLNSFNSLVTFDPSFYSLSNFFNGCPNYNQPVTIPEGVKNCAHMFFNCQLFNQSITIPSSVNNCAYMFSNCKNFKPEEFYIPYSVNNNCTDMFSLSSLFNSKIYMKFNPSRYGQNYNAMFRGVGNFIICTNNAYAMTLSSTASNRQMNFFFASLTWTSVTGGYYNATRNIYIYNNYQ